LTARIELPRNQEVCPWEQPFIKDQTSSVGQLIGGNPGKLGDADSANRGFDVPNKHGCQYAGLFATTLYFSGVAPSRLRKKGSEQESVKVVILQGLF